MHLHIFWIFYASLFLSTPDWSFVEETVLEFVPGKMNMGRSDTKVKTSILPKMVYEAKAICSWELHWNWHQIPHLEFQMFPAAHQILRQTPMVCSWTECQLEYSVEGRAECQEYWLSGDASGRWLYVESTWLHNETQWSCNENQMNTLWQPMNLKDT